MRREDPAGVDTGYLSSDKGREPSLIQSLALATLRLVTRMLGLGPVGMTLRKCWPPRTNWSFPGFSMTSASRSSNSSNEGD